MKKNIGEYRIGKHLGGGGNGSVYVATKGEEEDRCALKILNKTDRTSVQRFKDEIHIMKKLVGENTFGVMPILEDNLDAESEEYYYTMPIAKTLKDFHKEHGLRGVIEKFILLCDTLAELHDQDITHRDIKPDNILAYNNNFVFSDFGLVDYSDKENVTKKGDRVGAKNTIDPQMRRDATTAAFKSADVYSMAKTLYMLIANRDISFEGQYVKDDKSYSLSEILPREEFKFAGEWYLNSLIGLETLLIQSTKEDNTSRPTIREFRDQLKEWFHTNDNFDEYTAKEWNAFIKEIFPYGITNHAEWNDIKEIQNLLSKYFSKEQIAIAFMPDFGWSEIDSIEMDKHETNCLIINNSSTFKPKKLHFEYLGDPKWCYFLLEIDEQKPFDVNNVDEDGICEDKLKDGKHYSRYLKGAFVFTFKGSWLNKMNREFDLAANDKYHSIVSPQKYREFIEELYKIVYIKGNPTDTSISKDDIDESKLLFNLRTSFEDIN